MGELLVPEPEPVVEPVFVDGFAALVADLEVLSVRPFRPNRAQRRAVERARRKKR